MTLYIAPQTPLRVGRTVRLGEGAQGEVYGDEDNPGVCFKIYAHASAELSHRVSGLLRLPPADWKLADGYDLAWPHCAISDAGGRVRGVVLPRAYGGSLHVMFAPHLRVDHLDRPTWATCVRVAQAVAAIFAAFHPAGIVVGDVRPDNVMVGRCGRVTLIDCDSVQFTDPWTKVFFPASHATDAYSSPEAIRDRGRVLTPADDAFGLAIMVCQLLMEGDHPFTGVPAEGSDRGIAANIALGNCRLFHPERLVPVAGSLTGDVLPATVRELARRAFVDGHGEPDRRPTAAEWVAALASLNSGLMGCRRNRNHFYSEELSRCPWCHRRHAGLGEHYPSPDEIGSARAELDDAAAGPAPPAAGRWPVRTHPTRGRMA